MPRRIPLACGLAAILVGMVVAAPAPAAAHRWRPVSTRHALPRQARERLALIGYIPPWKKVPGWLGLGGGWSAHRGWIQPPIPASGNALPADWKATSWEFFPDPMAVGRIVKTKPTADWSEVGSSYALVAPAPAGVAVSRVANARPRRARRERPRRPELQASTRILLARHGVPAPANHRILEAYRVDLNGDGVEEVLWTARSRDGWRSPYREDRHAGPRPGDYALLGLRYVTRQGVRSVALAFAKAGDDCSEYRLFSSLDINGDGKMEILAHDQRFEEDALLAFTFDGQHVAGVLGTALPSDPQKHGAAPLKQ
jgi:hypothetical protein